MVVPPTENKPIKRNAPQFHQRFAHLYEPSPNAALSGKYSATHRAILGGFFEMDRAMARPARDFHYVSGDDPAVHVLRAVNELKRAGLLQERVLNPKVPRAKRETEFTVHPDHRDALIQYFTDVMKAR